MKVTCGTDIIEIDRIKENVENLGDKFVNRIYTEKEIEYCESKKGQKYQHYAGRFAAKEAAFKAISPILKDKSRITWKSFEVENDKEGKPHIYIHDIDNTAFESIDISISHCKNYAVAYVVAVVK